MLTFEITIWEVPALVKTTGCALLLPSVTFEKFRLVLLGSSIDAGVASTVSVAALLVTLVAAPSSSSPELVLTVTANCSPDSETVVGGVVYAAAVAPLMAAPPFFHWYFSAPVPAATTENVAVCPALTVWLAGWLEMARPAIPMPLRGIPKLEFEASLAMVTLPESLPEDAGLNRI